MFHLTLRVLLGSSPRPAGGGSRRWMYGSRLMLERTSGQSAEVDRLSLLGGDDSQC